MGLDIHAYEVVELEHVCALHEHEHDPSPRYGDGLLFLYRHPNWPERADGLVDGAYRASGKQASFRAGSYGGYNVWREELAALVGTTPDAVWKSPPAELPFVELINFSDCEGVIGPKTSAKLAKDFADWETRAVEWRPTHAAWDREWFLARYRDWKAAFELAAGRGCVEFS